MQIGDKVKVVETSTMYPYFEGREGTIIGTSPTSMYEWEVRFGIIGHNCCVFNASELEKVAD